MKKWLSLLLLAALLLTGCTAVPPAETTPSIPSAPGETLTVHFIDVGQADSILLECGGKYMIIDGGNVADSSLVVSYLQDQGVEELEAVVCSHAHEDHVGGLPGVLAVYPTKAVYAPTRTYSSKCFDDFVYYVDQQRLTIQIPQPGDSFSLGSARVTVLGPVKSYADTNNTSLVLLVEFGETSFLFTGDMESAAENDMLEYWEGKRSFKVDVLKVGHHGSSTSTGYRFLYETDPTYGVISVGKDNQFGHPNDEPMSRLHDADVTIHRTDEMGHIVAVSDGKDITFTWSNATAVPDGPDAPKEEASKPNPPTGSGVYFIGNVNSKVLHLPNCSSLPAEKNQIRFDSYSEAIAAGYHDCSRCKPGGK